MITLSRFMAMAGFLPDAAPHGMASWCHVRRARASRMNALGL
jgi:hypothetical protein